MAVVVSPAGRSNQLSFEVRPRTAPLPRPDIHSLSRYTARAGETIPDFTITGQNLEAVTAIQFGRGGGVTITNLRTTPNTVTAQVTFDSSLSPGFFVVVVVSPGGTSNFLIFSTFPPGPPGTFIISNLRAGPSGTPGLDTVIPIVVDFEDPSGAASSGEVRLNYNIENGSVFGFSSATPEGVTPGQTSGTLRLRIIFQGRLVGGPTLRIEVSLTNNRGLESNKLTGTFQTQ